MRFHFLRNLIQLYLLLLVQQIFKHFKIYSLSGICKKKLRLREQNEILSSAYVLKVKSLKY